MNNVGWAYWYNYGFFYSYPSYLKKFFWVGLFTESLSNIDKYVATITNRQKKSLIFFS